MILAAWKIKGISFPNPVSLTELIPMGERNVNRLKKLVISGLNLIVVFYSKNKQIHACQVKKIKLD